MRSLYIAPLLIIAAASIAACTTQLTEAGKQVNLVTVSTANGCKVIKGFTVKGSSNGDALNMAFNKAGEIGADSVSVIDVGTDDMIKAAALNCHH